MELQAGFEPASAGLEDRCLSARATGAWRPAPYPPPRAGRVIAYCSVAGRRLHTSPCKGEVDSICPGLAPGQMLSVGVRPLTRPFADHRGPRVDPHPAPPIKSGVADLPLSGRMRGRLG